MTVFKRLLFIALAAAMLLTALACGSNSGKSGETTAPDATAAAETTEATTEPPYEFLKNPEDFGGREFKVLNGAYTKATISTSTTAKNAATSSSKPFTSAESKTEESAQHQNNFNQNRRLDHNRRDIQKIVMAGDGEYSRLSSAR